MELEEITKRLKRVLSTQRYIHSDNVMKTAIQYAMKYQLDVSKVALAGILHDCARDIKDDELFVIAENKEVIFDEITRLQPKLIHAQLGARLASTLYDVNDKEILDAIRYHTTGSKNMSLLTKVIFLADYLEPDRNFPGINEIRKLAFEDLDSALLFALDKTIMHIVSRGLLVHPDTIDARNYLIIERGSHEKNR